MSVVVTIRIVNEAVILTNPATAIGLSLYFEYFFIYDTYVDIHEIQLL